MNLIRSFLALEAAAFGVAALLHLGVLAGGYDHSKAAIAESVIGFVLLAGLVTTFLAPRKSRAAGLFSQSFALLGTFVGLFTIAIGIGPRSAVDYVIHTVFVIVLASGLVLAWRQPRNTAA